MNGIVRGPRAMPGSAQAKKIKWDRMLRALCFASLMLSAATWSHAAAPYAFPDQPGALTAEEIRAATEAMKPRLGSGPALELVASGKRSPGHPMTSYALFAAPLVDYSGRVKTRRQIICNFFMAAWRCSEPVEEFRMSANGMEHVFSHQVVQGPGDRQAAVDAVDFMYSRCYGSQFAAIGGKPFTPSPDADFVNTVLDDGKGFTVVTGPLGDGDSYRLEKTDRSVDNCGFRIQHVRMARSGVVLPESYAREVAERAAKEGEKQRAAKESREKAEKERAEKQAGRKSEEELAIALARRGDVVLQCRADFSTVGAQLITVQITRGSRGNLHALINGAVSNIDVRADDYPVRDGLDLKTDPYSPQYSAFNPAEIALVHLQGLIDDKNLGPLAPSVAFDLKQVRKMRIYDLQGRPDKFGGTVLLAAYGADGQILGRVFRSVFANACR